MNKHSLLKRANLSLVCFTRNDHALLNEGLLQIPDWSVQPKEIIVVDDASEEEYQPPAGVGGESGPAPNLPEIQVLRSPHSLGYARAKNLGLHRARGRFILSLDADIRLIPDWLELCLEKISTPEIGMIGGPIVPDCGEHLFGRYMTLTYAINAGVSGKVKFLPGAAWLMRRPVWEELGGYNGYSGNAGEDDYLCRQLLERGYSLWVEPRAKASEVRKITRLQMVRRGWSWHGASIHRALEAGRPLQEAVNVLLYSLRPRINRSKQANPLYLYYDLLYLGNALFDLLGNTHQAAGLLASFQPWLAPFPALGNALASDLSALGFAEAPNVILNIPSAPPEHGRDISELLAFAFDQPALNALNRNLDTILAVT